MLPKELLVLQDATRQHQSEHDCNAHTFEDGEGLWRVVQAHQPRRILEFGTGLGYTSCLMALASPQAHVDTLEGDEIHAALAAQHIAQLGLQDRVQLHPGSFAVSLPALQLPLGSVDMVFFDGNMPPFILVRYFYDLLSPNGVLVCANLELNGPLGAKRSKAELQTTSRWRLLEPLEGGNTWVAQRVPQQA